MKTVTSKEAQESFGKLIDTALQEPVLITRNKRPAIVAISVAAFEKYEEALASTSKGKIHDSKGKL